MRKLAYALILVLLVNTIGFAVGGDVTEPEPEILLPAGGTLPQSGTGTATGIAFYLNPRATLARCTKKGQIIFDTALNKIRVCVATGNPGTWEDVSTGTSGGSVTSFSAGDLSPLFTTTETNPTTTPALSFTLSNAAAHTFFGNNTGSTAAPGFQSIGTGDLPTAIPATNIGDGSVSTPEFQFINTLSSNAQTQIDSKQSLITFGTGVQSAMGVNIGSAGAPILFNGAGGTPSSLVGTNITGTAAGFTAGNVTTNANSTGDVSSVGNVTTIVAGVIVNADINGSAAIDATKIGDGSVTTPEFQFINTLSSNAQTQIDGKQATLTNSAGLRGALSDENGTGAALFDAAVSPNLTTPIITGLPTGSGVASAGTASTVVARDANANITANNWLGGYTTTVSAAGTTTVTVGSGYLQFLTGSTTQTYTLPVASTLTLGHQFNINNNSTGLLTVNSSGGNAVVVIAGGGSAVLTCILTSGTTAASWSASYSGALVASGKKLTVSNTLTITGTDGSSLAVGGGGTLGTAAFQNTGTSGANLPFLNGANTWSAAQSFSSNILNSIDGTNSIGNPAGNRFIISAYGIEVGTSVGPVTGEIRTSGVQLGLGTTSATYKTGTNCTDSAGAAACGSAAAGSVVIDAGATSVVVSTTAVTANSQIQPFFDSSLGTRLGVTCNTTAALPTVSARTAGTSFTILITVAPVTNPACFGYTIVN